MEMVELGQLLPLHGCGEEMSGILLLTPTGGKSALIWMGCVPRDHSLDLDRMCSTG